MAVLLKCPDCEEKFRVESSPTEGFKYPDNCPCCGNYMGIDRPDDEIVMPAFLSARTKSNDDVYRQMEKGSEFRAQKAAEVAGCSVEEMSALKITDMDDRRDRETSAKSVVNDVTKHMEETTKRGAQWGFQQNGAEYSAGIANGAITVNGQVTEGIAPRAGMGMLETLNRMNGR